ncbi:low temperature requirement protein A [Streptomyces sp. NPDC056656]|uniref:low temperature requirement protein A n=1 Tax=Streptomyces sp. NPDC056656 TaxID=3345895 RepID=UPI00367377A4
MCGRADSAGSAASAVCWLGGLILLEGPARYAAWAVAMAAELVLPLLAGRHVARTTHDAEHLRERFGLFTIIVLGETVLGCTNGLVQARTAPAASVTGAAAFALCAGLWWSYFSASGTRPGAHEALARGGRLMHVYVFGHLPVQLGLAVTGGAVGAAVAGSGSHIAAPLAGCVLGGVALFLMATAMVRAAFTGPCDRVVLIRLVTAGAALCPLPLAGHAPRGRCPRRARGPARRVGRGRDPGPPPPPRPLGQRPGYGEGPRCAHAHRGPPGKATGTTRSDGLCGRPAVSRGVPSRDHVVVEGILHADHYGGMLARLRRPPWSVSRLLPVGLTQLGPGTLCSSPPPCPCVGRAWITGTAQNLYDPGDPFPQNKGLRVTALSPQELDGVLLALLSTASSRGCGESGVGELPDTLYPTRA